LAVRSVIRPDPDLRQLARAIVTLAIEIQKEDRKNNDAQDRAA
jgi:hypothetical protein